MGTELRRRQRSSGDLDQKGRILSPIWEIKKGFMEKVALNDTTDVESEGWGDPGLGPFLQAEGPASAEAWRGTATLWPIWVLSGGLSGGVSCPVRPKLNFPPDRLPFLNPRRPRLAPMNHTQSRGLWLPFPTHPPPTSLFLPAASSPGLPNSGLVQQGADVIQLARKHRLEKTHTVNLTGN